MIGSYTPLFLPVGPEVLVIVLIAILLFGAQRVPELAREVGRSGGEFLKAKRKSEQEVEKIRDELGMETDNKDASTSVEKDESDYGG